MCASSWAITSATVATSGCVALSRVDQQEALAIGDAAEVLHRALREVREPDHVHLLVGVRDPVVVGEVAEAERADLGGERGEVRLPGPMDDPQGYAVDVDRFRRIERADHERHQTGRHRHRVGEPTERVPAGSSRLISGPLEIAWRPSAVTRVTPNTAFRSGSSQHGNARRASVDSNCVVAIVRVRPSSSLYVDR
jgi:hypothetical protein